MLRRSYAIRAANLSHSLQWDGGRGIWLMGLLLAGAALLGIGDRARDALEYDRLRIAGGEWWRLLTAHLVHLDAHHFALNALGLVLVWALFARDFRAWQWLIITVGAALGISVGLYRFDPTVAWYVGASGLLHAIMGAGCVRHWNLREWDRWILWLGLATKLLVEQREGPGVLQGATVVIDAHLYGALCGAAIAAVLCVQMAIIRRSQQER